MGNRTAVIRTKNLTTEDLLWALNHAYSSWYKHRDAKLMNTPLEHRPNQWLDNYQPRSKSDKVLVMNYTDGRMAIHTATVLREKAAACELTLLAGNEVCAQPGIRELFTEVVPLPEFTGLKKITAFLQLLGVIRKGNYDLMVFLSDNACSYMRRFPVDFDLPERGENYHSYRYER